MPRKEHPVFGVVNERTFPTTELEVEESLVEALEDLKRRGEIHDYSLEKGILKLWRPWIEGQTQDDFFRTVSPGYRIGYSGSLFRQVLNKVRERSQGHGALHPRNIILTENGIRLVDAWFNRVRFDPRTVPKDDPWLWGPCVPKGWSFEDWDLVSLLRTAALLDLGPSAWETPMPKEEVAKVCRVWASKFSEKPFQEDTFLLRLAEAVALLPAIFDAEFELPVFPLERELETFFAQQGQDRVLLQKDEEELAARAAGYGLEGAELVQRLRAWMQLKGYQREVEAHVLDKQQPEADLRIKIRRLLHDSQQFLVKGERHQALDRIDEIFDL